MKSLSVIIFSLLVGAGLIVRSDSDTVKVTAGDLNSWVSYLSSDQMRGRLNGSPEMQESAQWIARLFAEFGLNSFDEHPGFIQEYETNSRGRTVSERNVIGYIPGTDPDLKDEYLILTAHFDHIGIRGQVDGDSIYNGADDNAAGTCMLLGIARYIRDNGIEPGRGIIFAAVSGEEIGLRGSRYLASHLPVEATNLYANLNFEMTGHSEYLGRGRYYMTGTGYSNLDDVIKPFSRDRGLSLVDTIPVAERLFFMSDNAAFARLSVNEGVSTGIPSGTFATTTMAGYIHGPKDEAQFFDFDNMALLVNHFAGVVAFLSDYQGTIDWTDKSFRRP